MKNPARWRKWSYVALMLVAITLSGTLHAPLLEQRDAWSYKSATENFPPSLVLGTQMLGTFRGMLIVGLWLRASELQEQGRYYELVQLYEWIAELEPRFESVWSYSAWNQAYNISVAFPYNQEKERWRWVQNGLSVIRDRGLKYNPRSYELYRQLSWIYFHKVGGTSDESHRYYKREFAKTLHVILGGPEPDYARLAAAAETVAELLADDAVAALVENAQDAGFDPLGRDIAWLNNDPAKLPEEVAPVFEAAKGTPALDALDAFLRVRALRDDWGVEPALVVPLIEKYGPVDFRVPWAHAIYWATEGLKHVKPTENPQHCVRQIYSSFKEIFETGRLIYYPESGEMYWTPDLRFVDVTNEAYRLKMIMGPNPGWKYWLRDAITMVYGYGDHEKAAELYQELQEVEPRPDYLPTVAEFVVAEIRKDLAENQFDQVRGYIRNYVRSAYFWLAAGAPDLSDGNLAMAKTLYIIYQQKAFGRFKLPPWEEFKKQVLDEVLDPERGLPSKRMRERLRRALKLPPEEEAAETPDEGE